MNQRSQVVDPHSAHPTTVASMLGSAFRNRHLIHEMARRAVIGRYRGSVFGVAWSFFTPIFLLLVYTFVFAVVFKARWGGLGGEESKTQFAIILFVGLIVHGLFAEVLNRAPSLIVSNVNYVKKVVFPLEILPIVELMAAIFHCFVSLLVLMAATLLLGGSIYWTACLIPLILLPLILFTLGMAWFLASIGVFLRDVGQIVGMLTMVVLFLSPVFYPVSALPEAYQPWIFLNPLTFIIEQAREVLIRGALPNWQGLFLYCVIASLVAWLGYSLFQKTRKGFADVI